MRNKIGTVGMLLGTMLLLAALSLFIWNRTEDKRAADSVEEVIGKLKDMIEEKPEEEETFYPEFCDPSMTEVMIDGYAYVGYLTIPGLDTDLPVMSEWDYTRLKIAPCRYSGSTKTDDLVIAAHNYSRHFGPLWEITEGEMIYFTDMDGKIWTYKVDAVETLLPTAVEEMTSGEWSLTLFTCTYGGQSRVTVRCDRVKES